MQEPESLVHARTRFVDDPDFVLYVGDVRDVLAGLPDGSIDCCVTSPPYFGLRDYGAGGQIGLEATLGEYVDALVDVFADVRRLLKPHGTLWLNLGDSYAGGGCGARDPERWPKQSRNDHMPTHAKRTTGLKKKDLMLVPARVAIALQDDGWWVRAENIWSKPNPMPESVIDRTTKAHEQVYTLAKSGRPTSWTHLVLDVERRWERPAPDYWWFAPLDHDFALVGEPSHTEVDGWIRKNAWRGHDYYYDAEAIAEPATWFGPNGKPKTGDHAGQMQARAGAKRPQMRRAAELAAAHGLTEAHISAIRTVGIADTGKALTTTTGAGKSAPEAQRLADEARAALGGYYREFLIPLTRNARSVWEIQTMQYADAHFAVFPEELPRRCILAGCPEGGTVLDPFMGSGTTAKVARDLGRKSVGVELNPEYAALCARRLSQQSLLTEIA